MEFINAKLNPEKIPEFQAGSNLKCKNIQVFLRGFI